MNAIVKDNIEANFTQLRLLNSNFFTKLIKRTKNNKSALSRAT